STVSAQATPPPQYTLLAYTTLFRSHGEPKPLEKVEPPDCRSIAQLAEFLGIEEVQTLKMVFYTVDAGEKGREIVLALLRGDLDVSEVKLKNEIGGGELIPATEEEIAAIGAVAGFASPIGLNVRTEQNPDGVLVIADESLKKMSNFTTGANELDYHYINANFPRDFQVTRFADIAEPYDGATCRSEEHTSELQSHENLVCRLLLEKK